jgi:DNA-binding LacI/PurR family transcriptional regulator
MAHTTQRDIARKLNVSRITVSKALRNHPDISMEMKKKVSETAEELGYIPNLIAQNLISKRTFTLGVAVRDFYPKKKEENHAYRKYFKKCGHRFIDDVFGFISIRKRIL